jgi:hypothetical protein
MTDPLLSPFRVTGVYFLKYSQEYVAETEILERYYFQPTLVSGLGIPTPNVRSSDAYRMHGSFFVGLNIPSRTVVLTIPVLGDIQEKSSDIYEWFAQDPSTVSRSYFDMYLELSTGKKVLSRRVVLSAITETLHEPLAQFLNITMFCPDPMWYDAVENTVSGSYAFVGPADTPIDATITVPVVGTGLSYPTITIAGATDELQFENEDTDQVFGPLALETALGETVVIQTAPALTNRGIYSDTTSPDNLITYAATPNLELYLDPGFGDNDIKVTGFVTAGTATITITWHNAYIGV